MFDIQEELKKLPDHPGVYLMHDARDVIIYIGKAVSLKNRVRQYFQSSRNKGPKIEKMVTHIARFEYILTDSELEALVLECNLIKEHRPKYNTMLKDDKTYPYIKVTLGEAYPRVLCSRQMKKDKSPLLWAIYQCGGGKGYHRTDPQAVPAAFLQQGAAAGYRKRTPLPELPHPPVPGSLPGLCVPGTVPGTDPAGCGFPEWEV